MVAKRILIIGTLLALGADACANDSELAALAAKASPALRAELAAKPAYPKSVIVVTGDLPGERPAATAAFPRRGGATRFITRLANLAQVSKLAARSDVLAILPDVPPDPIGAPEADLAVLSPMGRFDPSAFVSIAPQTWYAKDAHHASDAWALGITGEGVKVAICDMGIDFGHPDLQGCQARVENPDSPYYGWPIALDLCAMYTYTRLRRLTGGYVDTSFTAVGDSVSYNGRVHTLTGTSKSGVYHLGKHPGYNLQWTDPRGKKPSVLVVDENEPGVYDTVYVDLNKNADFRDDKPCRKGDEISWYDVDGDGLADWSGGMVYFIADGVHPIPASDWLYGLGPPANGSLVAFAGAFGKYEEHGTLCASAVVAQGVVDSGQPPWKPPGTGGMVQGMAPGARIVAVGSICENGQAVFDALRFCAYGYDGIPNTGDEPDIVNMSFGYSTIHADGWDFLARYLGQLVRESPKTTFVAAAGNGGPGYGTLTTPGASPFVVTAGASTLYGSTTAFEEIASVDQITFGNIQPWSGRGPNSLGQIKPDVAATGAFATGDVPLYGNARFAWSTWGGTSLSAPMTCGVLALVYQAYADAHGEFPTWEAAREILKSSAKDLGYDPLTQGAGMLDAYLAVAAAAELHGVTVSPDSWDAGDYRGTAYAAFPRLVIGGRTYSQTFEVSNHGELPVELSLDAVQLGLVSRSQVHLTAVTANEGTFGYEKPDYFIDPAPHIAPNADLIRIRLNFPFSSFSLSDPTSRSLLPANQWDLIVYQWNDLDGDGKYWNDCCPPNGVVDEGELEPLEMMRVNYGDTCSDYIEASIGHLQSAAAGTGKLVVGLQHRMRDLSIPETPLTVTFDSYSYRPWQQVNLSTNIVTVPAHGTAEFQAAIRYPFGQRPGLQAGYLRLIDPRSHETTLVPVGANVVSPRAINSPHPGIVDGVADEVSPHLNGAMFGGVDWYWRPEVGDWRFFFMDISDSAAQDGTAQALVNASWKATPTDIDLLIQGPNPSDSFSRSFPDIYGPSGAVLVGGSRDTNLGDGRYSFQTATGGPAEWVSAPMAPGLHLFQTHLVMYDGLGPEAPYQLQIGKLWTKPAEIIAHGGASGRLSAEIWSNLQIPDIKAQAYGLSQPVPFADQTIRQDGPGSPSSASWRYDFSVSDAGLMRFSTNSPAPIDIDLYLLWDADNNGVFDWNTEVVASSTKPDADEFVELRAPPSGNYRLAVHGYAVVPSPSTFDLNFLVVQGRLPTLVTPIRNSLLRKAIVSVDCPAVGPGDWQGVILVGPSAAPTAVAAPIRVSAP